MHALTPVHPGWDGTARPPWLSSIGDLAQFTVISQAGHLPQLEQPDATFGALDAFIRKDPGRPAA
jgi:pimeloyl-ACP methyl ester carboxylesterase